MRDIFIKDQRLVILRSLVDAGYDANESILDDCLALYGHNISRDLVRNHLNWLEEQGLVQIERLRRGERRSCCGRCEKTFTQSLNCI